jgi:hypothetical protein
MNSTRPILFCGVELIGTTELHDINNGVYLFTENVGSATSGVSDFALGVGIYSNSDRKPPLMGSQRHTDLIAPKGLDLYRVMKLRPLVQCAVKDLPATSCYCPEQTHITKILLTGMILQLIVSVSKIKR